MTTCRNIIEGALRKIAVLGAGTQLSFEEAEDARVLLNAMMASLSVAGGYVYAETKEAFNLTTAGSYTIGTGGVFNTARPINITSAYVTQGNIDYPLMMISNNEFSGINYKAISGITEYYYYDANFPLATLYLYPTPNGVSTITLNSFKQLSSFSDLDTVFSMPAEYEAMLIYNLAEWIAPEYEKEASMSVKKVADQTKTAIISQNIKNKSMIASLDCPTGDKRYYDLCNIYRGF